MGVKMEIRELQDEIKKIASKLESLDNRAFGKDGVFLHLIEEVGEIARNLFDEISGRAKFEKEKLGDEIADAIAMLFHLALLYDIDLESQIEKKVKELKLRFGVEA